MKEIPNKLRPGCQNAQPGFLWIALNCKTSGIFTKDSTKPGGNYLDRRWGMLKIKLFDEEHEADLEEAVNAFLENIPESKIKDVKYQVSISDSLRAEEEPTIYSYSILVIYSE
jgi:hypothetical protein